MLNSLQACRAVAAIIVVLYHAEHSIFRLPKYFGVEVLGGLVDFAPACLDFFFILSGFIIMYAHTADIGRPGAIGAYAWRRFSRAYLFYWAVMAVVTPVFLLKPSFGFEWQRDPDVIVRSFLLVPHPQFHMILSVAWTMVYEVFFYLVFASLILNRRFGIAIFAIWMTGILVHPWLGTSHGSFVLSQVHLRFGAGMIVCMIVQRWRIPAPRLLALLGLGMFLGVGVIWSYCGMLAHWHHLACFIFSSCLLIAGLVEADRSGLIGELRFLTYLGNAAFSIYLVHFVALSTIAKASQALFLDRYLPAPVLFGLYVIGAVGAGLICHHLVEHPIHVWTKQFFRRAKPRVIAAAPAVEIRRAA